MSLGLDRNPNLTPREREELDWEKESTRLQVELAQRKQDYELDLRKLEVKWTQIFRLPTAIILLPVKLVMSLAIPISVLTKYELPKEFWEFVKG
jgi:serine kinase of HPr protein (carbohydrate metabolism regulator)